MYSRDALSALWPLSGLPSQALDWIDLTGQDPVFPSSFAAGTAAQSIIAAAALAACELGHERGAPHQQVAVDMAYAAAECTGWFTLDGHEPELWDPFAGLCRCADGYVRVHTNFRHHRDGALRLLDLDPALQRGLGTSAEVAQARAEREAAEAQPPVLEAAIARLSHAIGVLAGGFPGDWRAALVESAPMLPVAPSLPLALPSEVIRQRPDLRADERRLAGATARIGVAEAARLPHFAIPLSFGTTASLLHDLFSGASLAWSAGVQANPTLYDGGRARAGVTAAQAGADAARLAYERDVRLALRDMEDALTALNSERQRRASLAAAADDSQQALDRATRLYRNGLSAYLPVLTAQRAAYQARDALALSQGGEVLGAIALYKALGAGWQDEPAADFTGNSSPIEQHPVAETAAGL